MIEQIHLPQCASTQQTLRELFHARSTPESTLLVSTELQTSGIGRKGNKWDYLPNSLAFSFNLNANKHFLITPLEIGILLKKFFEQKTGESIELKWPNDLIINKGKCGGILCQSDDMKNCFIGIGINASDTQNNSYKIEARSIKLEQKSQKELPYEIVSFIKENRINSEQIKNEWIEACYHKNKMVRIVDGDVTECTGKFIGIGDNGEAILDCNGSIKEILSGSLFLI